MAAIISGAFVISSNRVDTHLFSGRALVIDPNGEVLAETSRYTPFVTVDIDLLESTLAQMTTHAMHKSSILSSHEDGTFLEDTNTCGKAGIIFIA